MRIIAGTAGGRRLKAPRGAATRPTADKVRQAVFNILAARGPVPERVLDLYAGSGALGLEALSRGCAHATFVERDRAACALIRDNAHALGFAAASEVACAEVGRWLDDAPAATRYGWIFLDPPYAAGALDEVLSRVARLLAGGGVAIFEHDAKTLLEVAHEGLALSDQRRYGQTAISFYEGIS